MTNEIRLIAIWLNLTKELHIHTPINISKSEMEDEKNSVKSDGQMGGGKNLNFEWGYLPKKNRKKGELEADSSQGLTHTQLEMHGCVPMYSAL